MRTTVLLGMLLLFVGVTSCSSDDDAAPLMEVESSKASNIHAPQQGGQGKPVSGPFTKFDFKTGKITSSDQEWDIAFRGTTIIVNGGAPSGTTDEPARSGEAAAYIASGTSLAGVTSVDTSKLTQDGADGLAISTGSGEGWYTYDSTTHIVSPVVGKVLVVKTRDGRYAKLEILSYYKDAPAPADLTQEIILGSSRYYTFNYVYQPNDGVTTF
ncbi:hypothetical protein HN014_05410 [Aquimarina sp. TRL1]|uniref:HmuY family protein n=1 Tax=Aquimarina sp. (strain TRL1) TaxID=2736252 RepID=UPI00158E7BB5|nr:HmuY family protein [Aquimarina sp. TRL1]QKX04369.1 hypothetical protein HN014_05410 [Aquimarina sp. TRL1]